MALQPLFSSPLLPLYDYPATAPTQPPQQKTRVKLYNLNKTDFTQKGYYMKALHVWKPMVLLTRVGNDGKAFKCGKNNQTHPAILVSKKAKNGPKNVRHLSDRSATFLTSLVYVSRLGRVMRLEFFMFIKFKGHTPFGAAVYKKFGHPLFLLSTLELE